MLTEQIEVARDVQFVRVYRKYKRLPGPIVVVSERIDPVSCSRITVTKQKKLSSAITVGMSIGEGSVISTERQDINGYSAFEVIETTGPSPYDSEANRAKHLGRAGPAHDQDLVGGVGDQAHGALRRMHHGRLGHQHQSFKCLHDAITRAYGSFVVTIPATVPSLTDYYGAVGSIVAGEPPPDPFAAGTGTKWIGTAKRIAVNIEEDGHPGRWRIDVTTVVMR